MPTTRSLEWRLILVSKSKRILFLPPKKPSLAKRSSEKQWPKTSKIANKILWRTKEKLNGLRCVLRSRQKPRKTSSISQASKLCKFLRLKESVVSKLQLTRQRKSKSLKDCKRSRKKSKKLSSHKSRSIWSSQWSLPRNQSESRTTTTMTTVRILSIQIALQRKKTTMTWCQSELTKPRRRPKWTM